MGVRKVPLMTRTALRTAAMAIVTVAGYLAATLVMGTMALLAPTANANPAPSPYLPALLTVDAETAPPALVDSLLEAGYHGDPTDHAERLYVPVGTVVDVPGGLYLATADGWMSCVDFETSDQECSATSPVVPVEIPA